MRNNQEILKLAVAEFIDHTTDILADGIIDYQQDRQAFDAEGNLWFYLRGYSNTDGEIVRDYRLYQARVEGSWGNEKGVIRAFWPDPEHEPTYWDGDWETDPLARLYFDDMQRYLLGVYFTKPEIEARFNPKTGALTSRYFDLPFGGRRAVRGLYSEKNNPLRCTIAGNPESYTFEKP